MKKISSPWMQTTYCTYVWSEVYNNSEYSHLINTTTRSPMCANLYRNLPPHTDRSQVDRIGNNLAGSGGVGGIAGMASLIGLFVGVEQRTSTLPTVTTGISTTTTPSMTTSSTTAVTLVTTTSAPTTTTCPPGGM